MKIFSYRNLIYLACGLALVVIALGAYTRLTEAGLGCPDWPGCYGFMTVPETAEQQEIARQAFPDAPIETGKAWNEMVHRYVAGTLGLLVLMIALVSWFKAGAPKLLPTLLLAVVVFQALLGMWTVTMNLMPVVVMGHLLGGFATAALLLLLALRVGKTSSDDNKYTSAQHYRQMRELLPWGILALVIVIGQIALGGWTSANYAAVVCTQLPLCEVDWQAKFDWSAFFLIQPEHDSYQYGVLNFDQRVSIHVAHRIGALVATVVVLALAWRLWLIRPLRRYAFLLLAVLSVQLGLGITNILASLPLAVAVAHNLVGACLLLSLVAVNYRVVREYRQARYGVEVGVMNTGERQSWLKQKY